ncbi:TPA: hypothetical protein BOS_13043 [Bos taurus]|nr:TPA: hypothetical protein BOS_13043 [Bos taurus]
MERPSSAARGKHPTRVSPSPRVPGVLQSFHSRKRAQDAGSLPGCGFYTKSLHVSQHHRVAVEAHANVLLSEWFAALNFQP